MCGGDPVAAVAFIGLVTIGLAVKYTRKRTEFEGCVAISINYSCPPMFANMRVQIDGIYT